MFPLGSFFKLLVLPYTVESIKCLLAATVLWEKLKCDSEKQSSLNLEVFHSENSWSTVKREEGKICGAFTLWKRHFLGFFFGCFWVVIFFSFWDKCKVQNYFTFFEDVITVGFWWWFHFFHPNNIPKPKLPLTYLLYLGCA